MIVSNLTTSERISDDDAYTTITDIIIQEYAKGTNANLECGGPAMGMCDRQLGICRCIDYQGSSNGSNAPGEEILLRVASVYLKHILRCRFDR